MERNFVQGFFSIVQTGEVKQAVGKPGDMTGWFKDVSEIGIAAFPVTSIHGQFSTATDGIERSSYVMGKCDDYFLAHVGECTVLCCRIFQFSLVPFPAVKVTHDDKVRNDEQDDGHADYSCH